MLYADDTTLLDLDEERLRQATVIFDKTCSDFGLTLNASKTNCMRVGPPSLGGTSQLPSSFALDGKDRTVEYVRSFVYLGFELNEDGFHTKGIDRAISRARNAFDKLKRIFSIHRYIDT